MNLKLKYLRPGLTAVLMSAMTQPAFGQPAEQSSSQETEQSPEEQKEKHFLEFSHLLGNVPVLKRFSVTWKPVPTVTSRNGKFEIKLRGRVYWDHAWINNSAGTIDINSSQFRTARIGFDGRYGKKFSFRVELDFAQNERDYKDMYLEWHGWADVRLGYHKFSSPMEGSSSIRAIPLMERSAMYSAFGFGRKAGLSLTKTFKNGMAEIGFGKGKGDDSKISSPGSILAARMIYSIPIEDGFIHLGVSLTGQKIKSDNQEFFLATRPFQRQSPVLLNTGRIATKTIFLGLEGGMFKGPLSVVGEAGFLKATLGAPMQGQSNPTFWGWNITAAYFLTGEKGYLAKYGVYSKPEVLKPVWKGGRGAVQVAARYDYIDLVDGDIFGGIQRTLVLGVNWWLSTRVRLMVNYSHSKISKAFLVPANGPDGDNNVHTFGIRVQIDL